MMIYCPYTDGDIDERISNSEHIIPLSLGGINGFKIPVCKDFNSKVGTEIDAKIGQELIIHSRRTNLKIKGHSGIIPEMYYKNAQDAETDLPLQVKITKDHGIKANAPYIPEGAKHPTGKVIKFSVTSDMDIWLKYVAKVALSAGYFSYGNLFRKYVNTDDLRNIMTKSNADLIKNHSDMNVYAHYLYMGDETQEIKIYQHICKAVGNYSCVGIVPGDKSLTFFAGILGVYIGMIRVEADTHEFPNENEYKWGHFMCPQNGRLFRISYHCLMKRLIGIEN